MPLRVVDAGTVDPWRSQALWHGIAAAMDRESTPTLSFCRPAAPYVGLGYHRSLDEIDLGACRRLGLPVIRRQIGGGPVYVDRDQLFFQITLPAEQAPGRVDRLYELGLEPAAAAFRALGLAVRRNGWNDLSVDTRKISGTGAGQIGDGVTVVGNVIFRFPHARMVEILALSGDALRRECLRLMQRHVSSLAGEGREAVGFGEARSALIEAYSAAFGGRWTAAGLTAAEEQAIRSWEERFQDPSWLTGPTPPARAVRQVKISADAWMVTAAGDGLRVEASIAGGRLERIVVEGEGLDGAAISRALAGADGRPEALRRVLEPYGEPGRRALRLMEPGLKLRA